MRSVRFWSVVILVLAPALAHAQPLDEKAIDAIVEQGRKEFSSPGIAVAIVGPDQVHYFKGFGMREVGGDKPVTPDTLFAIASCSKAFTATVIGMLVDDGKVAWDDPVRKHLPMFHMADPLADREVTLRDCLCHRTGIPRNDVLWLNQAWGREELIRRIAFLKATKPLRSGYMYNNLMFVAAGHAAAKAADTSWEDLVQKRIFDPLGMKTANFSVTSMDQSPDHARPHKLTDKETVEVMPQRLIDPIAPAGGINASARDMTRWVQFQLGDGTFEGKRLLSNRNLQETHTPQIVVPRLIGQSREMYPEDVFAFLNYGLAWNVDDYRGHVIITHSGSIGGFRSNVVLLPKEKLGIVVLANLAESLFPNAMGLALTDHVLKLPPKDWIVSRHALAKRTKATEARNRARRLAERKTGTKPSLEPAGYVGVYEEPGYGQANITLDNEVLTLTWGSQKYRLEHFHFDTYTLVGENLTSADDNRVVFHLDAAGQIQGLTFLGQEFKKSIALRRAS